MFFVVPTIVLYIYFVGDIWPIEFDPRECYTTAPFGNGLVYRMMV
jgi:hypothetical protein